DPGRLEKMIVFLMNEWRKTTARGQEVALLTDASLRRPLRHALQRGMPDLAVIAFQEVPGDLLLEPAALLRPEDLAGARPFAA
ncbi:MAG TPA: flagellar biosynthesis protein FlhA, partial [Gemmataceae bacterium]|nr:flagellar biosynthesis protein FlhA [Gemmataceae bacterium]